MIEVIWARITIVYKVDGIVRKKTRTVGCKESKISYKEVGIKGSEGVEDLRVYWGVINVRMVDFIHEKLERI